LGEGGRIARAAKTCKACAANAFRMIDHSTRWLGGFAAAYLVLLPTNAAVAPRSVAFGGMLLMLLVLGIAAVRAHRRGNTPSGPDITLPGPPPVISATFAAWALWSAASWFWSARPDYSAEEIRRDILDAALVATAFYLAARDAFALRVLMGLALASFAVLAALALGQAAGHGWDAGRRHHGAGVWSTWVVLIAPFVLLPIAPAPLGARQRAAAFALLAALVALMLLSARLSDNRMVWLALGTVFATAALLAAVRWRSAYGQTSLRWAAALVALLIAFSVLFVDTAREKAAVYYPPHTTVEETLKHDPRIALWEYTAGRIRERPWTGHGFGRTIVAPEMRVALHDPLLTHAHNVFVSQWLQTGAIGSALFVALLAAMAWRYAALFRARDDALAFVGLVGLALLAGFVVKNLTDDFLFRSNAKEFFALNAVLLGFGAWRTREQAAAAGAGTDVENR
jgi:O-antigen ligase